MARWWTFICALALGAVVVAQDAEVGKEYDITIDTEQDNQYTGPNGQAKVGQIVFSIPNAKKGERYHVKVLEIRDHQYTMARQASCDFQQIEGTRKGQCIPAP